MGRLKPLAAPPARDLSVALPAAAAIPGATPTGAASLPHAVTAVDLPLPRARSGKVRECFDLGERLLLVATDRISAFDVVFDRGIPGKGVVLTGISRFWFERLDAGVAGAPAVSHHLLTADAGAIAEELGFAPPARTVLAGRTMLVRKLNPVPFECVVRGFLEGSALADYAAGGHVAGIRLPPGLRRGDRLRHPLFTPARKSLQGHDENVTFDEMARALGGPLAETLRDLSLRLYAMGAAVLAERALLLADTKFEFGLPPDAAGDPVLRERPVLIDEVLTPDSSRLWEADRWEPGHAQPSYDKQPLRDWLEELVRQGAWNKRPPAPELLDHVVRETAQRYAAAHLRITGRPLAVPDVLAAAAVDGVGTDEGAGAKEGVGTKQGARAKQGATPKEGEATAGGGRP